MAQSTLTVFMARTALFFQRNWAAMLLVVALGAAVVGMIWLRSGQIVEGVEVSGVIIGISQNSTYSGNHTYYLRIKLDDDTEATVVRRPLGGYRVGLRVRLGVKQGPVDDAKSYFLIGPVPEVDDGAGLLNDRKIVAA